mmetsp:Transcript_6453/g.19925  ORF Transcript_6453/g.19925 Transcript_6453/m.19925 type:complete len:268 (-) Transcript_6453:1325-2128(-)
MRVDFIHIESQRPRHVVIQDRHRGLVSSQAQLWPPCSPGTAQLPEVAEMHGEVLVGLPGIVVDDFDLDGPLALVRQEAQATLCAQEAHALSRGALLRVIGDLQRAAGRPACHDLQLQRPGTLQDHVLRFVKTHGDGTSTAGRNQGACDLAHEIRADLGPRGRRALGLRAVLQHQAQRVCGKLFAELFLDLGHLACDPRVPAPLESRPRGFVAAPQHGAPPALVCSEGQKAQQGKHGEGHDTLPALHPVGGEHLQNDQQPDVGEHREH